MIFNAWLLLGSDRALLRSKACFYCIIFYLFYNLLVSFICLALSLKSPTRGVSINCCILLYCNESVKIACNELEQPPSGLYCTFDPNQLLWRHLILTVPSKPLKGYRKIPKISPGAYIFQRPFLRSLFLEGPIFGGAYVRREICVSKLTELACSGKEIYHFCFVLLCIRGQIPNTSPPGGLYSEGQFNRGFL